MSLRAHLRSRFHKQTPPTEGALQKRSSNTSDIQASSGSDDVNSSADELSLSDHVMEGGSPSSGRKKYDKGGASGDSSSPGTRRKGRLSNEESRKRSGSTTSQRSQWEDSEKNIYETQLRTLQEQLVDSMIQNQTLQSEVTKFRENSDMTKLLQMLDHEKDNSAKLSQECEELQQQLENIERRSYSMEERPSSVDTAEEADSVDLAPSETEPQPPRKPTLKTQMQEWLMNTVYEVIADFTEDPDDEKTTENDEGEELAVKKLKANIKRFKAGYQPIIQWLKAVGNLFGWKSAPASFLAFIIYMYAVAKGWLISLMLGLALWHLTKTYLISKGFVIKFSLLPYCEEEENSDMDKQLGLSDKFQLVLLVARRVQNYMGLLADGLEKIQNLVMWGNPEATQKLYTGLLCAFIASVVLPGEWFFICGGIYLGVKVFITGNIFSRFPRVKAKYDSSYIMWQSLPTHAQKQRRNTLERRRKYIIPAVVTERTPADEGQGNFLEMFSLPSEELPLPGWQTGKRCTQIVRDKSVSFKNGRIYLTRSFLCFERSRLKNRVDKHIVIPLADIVTIEKAKPFFLMPGSGMSIEIRVVSEEKPYIFGAILNRDEVHAVILRQVCSVRDVRLKDKTKHKETSVKDGRAAGTSASSNQ
ncbi:GRAM domain-containing protein 4-like isoform X2 [Patiria miniata]|uniref:GRAM domain-containing protein n=1 Tax=Patiria miniata TaxID=46514 RepID=A0A913ZT71_PATMI|nr:GRAM domain-containing protein 4-like isoform X2 [Patiria miniata]